jgi:hypothetical protein
VAAVDLEAVKALAVVEVAEVAAVPVGTGVRQDVNVS